MKEPISKVFSIVALFVLVGTLGVGSLQYAFADPGPTCLLPSAFTTLDSFITWTCWGDGVFTPHTGGSSVVFRAFEPGAVPDTTVSFPGGLSCGTPVVAGGGGTDGFTDAFLLDNAALFGTQANLWTIVQPTVGPSFPPGPLAGLQDSISFYYPSGPAAILTSITTDGTAPPPSLAGPSAWVQIGSNPATTPALLLGSWTILTCVVDGSTGVTGGDIDGFTVQRPVAGEVLSINTTALLIAGAQQNAIWALSALAVIAGVSFTLLKFKVNKVSI